MSDRQGHRIIFGAIRSLLPLLVLLLITALPTVAGSAQPDSSKKVGDRAPLFTVVTNQNALADYNRDYYGRHHLVMTFFPAAFTPV